MKKTISILGSTGSIGLTTFKIIDKKKKFFKINILVANKNFSLISHQIRKYKPKAFVISNEKIFKKIKKKFHRNKTKILNTLKDINLQKSDCTISAIPGIDGLTPTLQMIKKSKKILIANKESIIYGWSLIKKESLKFKTKIIPVDSEHYSIMKLIENHTLDEIKMIYITASGGPFLNLPIKRFKRIKPKHAVRHPKWKMGKKISVDSSTLMNKILELIEAQKIFNLPKNKIDIIIHPESLVHAIVKFKNGITKFIYHETSMMIPLANAIFDENFNFDEFINFENSKIKRNIQNLNFREVDNKKFPIIKIKKRLNEYPATPIIINTCNEILVDQFLRKKIAFLSIHKIILSILNDRNYRKYAIKDTKNLNQIIDIYKWTKTLTLKKINLSND